MSISKRDKQELITKRDEIVERYGPWTSHNFHLGHDVWTKPDVAPGEHWAIPLYREMVRDFGFDSLTGVSFADLACLEGLHALAFAREGADALALEGRRSNLAKAELVREIQGISNCRTALDDVRNFTREKYGTFDIVNCSGVLYHLDFPDCLELVENVAACTERLAIFNTWIAPLKDGELVDPVLGPLEARKHNGVEYHGRVFVEHQDTMTADQKEMRHWASLDNNESFFLTAESLYQTLYDAGFRSVYDYRYTPRMGSEKQKRLLLVALK